MAISPVLHMAIFACVISRGLSCPIHITALIAGYRKNTVVALNCPT